MTVISSAVSCLVGAVQLVVSSIDRELLVVVNDSFQSILVCGRARLTDATGRGGAGDALTWCGRSAGQPVAASMAALGSAGGVSWWRGLARLSALM